jgi:hypothetical protein
MNKDDLKKIADAIADGITAQKAPLPGCGSPSNSNQFSCGSYVCLASAYQCGGAANFDCNYTFNCNILFQCYSAFNCHMVFNCNAPYNP